MLAYALHYEVRLMRKIMIIFKHLRLIRQKERLHTRLARQTYMKNLKHKTFISLHRYYIKHEGHSESNN